jgi:hypothetical protein
VPAASGGESGFNQTAVTLFRVAALTHYTKPINLEAVMKTHSKFSSILTAVMVMILAVPSGAWAGGGRYNNGGHDGGYQKKGQYSSHYNTHYKNYYNNYYNNSYYKGGGYNYPKYYGYNSCANNNKHHHNNNNNNDKLWIGLLGGGIVGYTLSNIHSGY